MKGRPFDENVEGLSHFRDKSYAVEGKVQTDDIEVAPFFRYISSNPFILKSLRKFKP
jgi:hypothetical protein